MKEIIIHFRWWGVIEKTTWMSSEIFDEYLSLVFKNDFFYYDL